MTSSSFIWKPTKFFNGIGQLLDKDSSKLLIEKLGGKSRINTDVGFKTPGYKYFKFLRTDDFEMIKSFPHLVTSNYGINPIWCLWLTTIDQTHYSFYINFVTEQIIWSKHRFAPKLYRGTFFEGEIIDGTFVIWDILLNEGKNISNLNLYQRLDIIKGIFNFQYVADTVIENIPIKVKKYVSYQHIKSFVTDILSEDKFNQGLLFIPVRRSVKCYSVIFNGNHQINRFPSHLDQLEESDLHPQKIIYGKPIIPSSDLKNGDGGVGDGGIGNGGIGNGGVGDGGDIVEEFWICPADRNCYNYYLHKINNFQMIRHGFAVIQSKEKSLEMQSIFTKNKGLTKNGIKNLFKFKCKYVKHFRTWEPIDLTMNNEQ